MVLCIHCVMRSIKMAVRRFAARFGDDDDPWGEWIIMITPGEGGHFYTTTYEGRWSEGPDIARRKVASLAITIGEAITGSYEVMSVEEFERRRARRSWRQIGETDSAGRRVDPTVLN